MFHATLDLLMIVTVTICRSPSIRRAVDGQPGTSFAGIERGGGIDRTVATIGVMTASVRTGGFEAPELREGS
jgi:hypothetical protein